MALHNTLSHLYPDNTPLHNAILTRDFPTVVKCLEMDEKQYNENRTLFEEKEAKQKLFVNTLSLGNSPLLLALKTGNSEIAKMILEKSFIDVTLSDSYHNDALDWACMLRENEIIHSILDRLNKINEYDYEEAYSLYYKNLVSRGTLLNPQEPLEGTWFHLENLAKNLFNIDIEAKIREESSERIDWITVRSWNRFSYIYNHFIEEFCNKRNSLPTDGLVLIRLNFKSKGVLQKLYLEGSKTLIFSASREKKSIQLTTLAELAKLQKGPLPTPLQILITHNRESTEKKEEIALKIKFKP